MGDINTYIQQIIQLGIGFAPRIVLALFVLFAGFWLANKTTDITAKVLKNLNTQSVEVQTFVGSIVSIGFKILIVISVAGIVGIETTSFVGIIAAMGFAVGLALQGNLSNFAAGVMILIMKPFKVGDEVKTGNTWAFVSEIQIFHTVFKELDSTLTIIPNSIILNNSIQNFSTLPIRKIMVKVNVPYTEDFFKVKKILMEAGLSVPEVENDVKPFFLVKKFDDHFIRISMSFGTESKKYWTAKTKVYEAVVQAFHDHNIKVAYPVGVGFGEFGLEPVAVS
ncbi:mechanosensitive ion channel family protein [Aureispira anguillae]|uniref:Mechanosensitive ion channel family protein n=1 Tax=Aureispira anguillae TaxID=2864201 RepID=A0A915VKC0_9BACT|nr:mechanosensitive ion channel family protein [Aureispira anguillae]BDS09612.1 mechanosensitive ion channel family protein [Aureispira anguillae]